MTPEFSRRIAVDTVGNASRSVQLLADASECAALAARLDLQEIVRLTADVALVARAAGLDADGQLSATFVQTCVVTGDPVPAEINEPFALRFVDPALLDSGADERELADADCDLLPFENGMIDLGEAVAQTLALALDPFPRAPTAPPEGESVWRAGPEGGAFAGLKGLLGE